MPDLVAAKVFSTGVVSSSDWQEGKKWLLRARILQHVYFNSPEHRDGAVFGGFIQPDKHRRRKLSQAEEIKAEIALTQINKSTNTHKNEDGVIEIKADQFLRTPVRQSSSMFR